MWQVVISRDRKTCKKGHFINIVNMMNYCHKWCKFCYCRLLKEMGWNETDDEEYVITEDDMKEFQNLTKQVRTYVWKELFRRLACRGITCILVFYHFIKRIRVPTRPGKPGKMRVHLEISWNFEKINKYHVKMTWNLEKLGGC